jgi:membrane protease YdiL (CAAX protease family)
MILLVGFGVAIWLRVAVGGAAVASSAPAGLVFAAGLTVLTLTAGVRMRPSLRSAVWGLVGAVVLCVPLLFTGAGHRPAGPYLPWAAVVTIVAVAEEAFLRGALYENLCVITEGRGIPGVIRKKFAGHRAALLVTSVCFAALHLPLYGWHVLPLDLAVGLWLGALRQTAGDWTAPAIAHVLADLTGWWLR